MLISLDWIKDYVELPAFEAAELATRFTLATAEVEDVVATNQVFEQIKVAEIISFEKHPQADNLNLVTFKYAENKTDQVVCGAANVRVGLKTPYARVGLSLPNGMTLEPKKIRGIESRGMLCSKEELGFEDSSHGIMELPADAPVGVSLASYLQLKTDILLDIDNKSLTHRPDLWGHYGMAREMATIFAAELKRPFGVEWTKKLHSSFSAAPSPIKIKVEKDSAGLAYFGLSVNSVRVAPSPQWMQQRLNSVGMRPINNIVDISNYVMLELGMPLHIFDRNKIKGDTLFIHRLSENQQFVTLDEISRELRAGDTVISDAEQPLVLAGIMGGLNSGVSETTTQIFIEVANWRPSNIRKTSTRLGLRTESSLRYEKSLDSKLCERTLLRTLELIKQICPPAQVIGTLEYDGDDLSKIEQLEINTSVQKINSVLGHELQAERIISIFNSLDFLVERSGDTLKVKVPSFRATKDIEFEEDLIEEIGRIVGYDNIVPVSPIFSVAPVSLSHAQKLHRKIREFLSLHVNCMEIMTYPMIGANLLKDSMWEGNCLQLLNALSKDHDQMRPSLIPSMLEAAKNNCKHMDDFKIFELGRRYLPESKQFVDEGTQLGVMFYNKNHSSFMELLNSLEATLNYLKIPYDFCEKNSKFANPLLCRQDWNGLHPSEYLNIRIMGKMQGVVFTVHPVVLNNFKIKGHLSLAVVDLTSFENNVIKDKTKYRPLSKFPTATFDCTVAVDEQISVEEILSAIKKIKLKEIMSSKIVDIYRPSPGKKMVTIRTLMGDPQKTLSPEFIKSAEDQIVATLNRAGYQLKMG